MKIFINCLLVITVFMAVAKLAIAESYTKYDQNNFSEFYVDEETIVRKQHPEFGKMVGFTALTKMNQGESAKRLGKKYKKVIGIESEYAVTCKTGNFIIKSTKLLDANGKTLFKEGGTDVDTAKPGTYIYGAIKDICK